MVLRIKFRYIYISIIILVLISYYKKNQLGASHLSEELFAQPKQEIVTEGSDQKLKFNYFGNDYEVEKKAEYEISGLVVSHNNISGWGDIYHDETSVDSKDLCVIWGENLNSEDYKKVSYSSGSWTCYFQYDRSIKFNKFELSNNHLITNDESVRNIINKVSIGDQIKIKGHLVNYRDTKWNYWRKSSLTRQDTGNQACEVIFVKSIDVLKSPNAFWRSLYKISKISLVVLLLFQITLFFLFKKKD